MKNNNRWSQLSMQQRADFFKKAIELGITDRKTIIDTYNKYRSGGRILSGEESEESTLSGNKPTLEEYIQHKIDSTRNAALEKSYARTKGILIPYAFGEGEKEEVKERLESAMPYAVKFTYGPFTSEQEEFEVKSANYFLGDYYQAKKELEDNCKYGFNCIGTATDNYPEESRTVSNEDFDVNFEKYGFQYVGMKNAKPGDIAKVPGHAMIYVGTDVNGNPLFNYSDGGITEYDYKKDARYPAPYYGVYRYVGTPELIQQWTEEYNSKKSHGGRILDGTSEENQTLSNTQVMNDLNSQMLYTPQPKKETLITPPLEIGQKHINQRDYIGGTPNEARIKAFNKMPRIKEHIEELSNIYGIDKNVLAHRFLREGWMDKKIQKYNQSNSLAQREFFDKEPLKGVNGFEELGLDDAATLLSKDKYNLRKELPYWVVDAENEKGRRVYSIFAHNLYDALEFKAADMEYRKNELLKKGFPEEEINMYINAAYNLGINHKDLNDAEWIRKNYTVPSYYKKGGKILTKRCK